VREIADTVDSLGVSLVKTIFIIELNELFSSCLAHRPSACVRDLQRYNTKVISTVHIPNLVFSISVLVPFPYVPYLHSLDSIHYLRTRLASRCISLAKLLHSLSLPLPTTYVRPPVAPDKERVDRVLGLLDIVLKNVSESTLHITGTFSIHLEH